jgi:Flp pilus assembly protein TadG
MDIRKLRGGRRRGAVVLETAVVAIWMLVFVFGIFEYSRLLMDWQLLNNATREGCRYALANNTSSTINADVQATVTHFMAGQAASFSIFTVTVSGKQNGVSTPVNNLSAGDQLTVTVSGKYQFMNIIPLVPKPPSLTITSSVTTVCEGGV